MEKRINSFPPFIDKDSQILILGSIPGVKSLEAQQYYAHPQNHFWKLISTILAEPLKTDYEKRVEMLKRNRIAIWDTIESCERKGSKDTDIKNEEANDIAQLLVDFPNIKAIFCNGQKAFKNLSRQLKDKEISVKIYSLPSSSPLHTVGLDKKLPEWTQILHYLHD
ncbi:DNA-deoxyinosine glycosylase [Elizabethkingia meningoseptica]|uniref:DNA-deoxyinosine glycosylase n=1 Tax=Elizabethkingia meningoseptica TaxID=238 RepID=A0A1V3TYC3_ELIME|nr:MULTISPECIES: DNA-deoxyinosine glycosylase [Elizabethkingia]AQX13245.1 DNA-deoxyinosine glycosylase [Elizabethkingia meningoseptica]MBG0514872.1 DNA-deoxyinosine glycosylase [Elizabethkingia meningoseptica]MDE5431316.1 DNA-deoxyinosine glycosylase [Elizabethkingia meningoseptica]MDE5433708.1 DNA-deoxyinosine glycosylase [Elizabethkingia meningoseptica]MDE5447410.1 DNA-deoxyinosine glycosylase [Elizabethkingia meningoseptica]